MANISDLATSLGVLIGATSLVVGVVNAQRDQRAKRLEREAEVLQAMNDRFQDMVRQRRELDFRTRAGAGIGAEETYAFYASYWSLQIDQWEHYRLGVISRHVFVTWMCYLLDALAGFHRIGSVDSRASWERIGRSLARNNVEFALLIEQLFQLAADARSFSPDAPEDTRPSERLKVRNRVRAIVRTTPRWIRGASVPLKLRKYSTANVLPRNLPPEALPTNPADPL